MSRAEIDGESPRELIDSLASSIDALEKQLDTVLGPVDNPKTVDSIANELSGTERAKPYAVAAYSLSSALFAYLKSEGRDTDLVKPELARVQVRLGKLESKLNAKK